MERRRRGFNISVDEFLGGVWKEGFILDSIGTEKTGKEVRVEGFK